ncbi:MAG: amino acid adenylation domain-containing protein [Candidatus Thiosymbion ectosymbiont of Robbea hypermnestra]|nr:amino acid adenylation domain-containing protein [Candidatus Thiosymbion ectosymbiont of Robbea hypermnestra]
MMELAKFIEGILAQGIELWVDDERLRYRSSQGAPTQALLNSIRQHKTEILQLLRERALVTKTYPLSRGQQALWFLYQGARKSAAYNTVSSICILSPVDASALRRTLQTLTNRHPSLRTTFTMQEGRPVQAIHGYREVDFQETDASQWSPDELRERVIEAYRQPLDLQQGPLLRASLFTRSREEHVFLVTIHHIVFDAWSTWIFWDEFAHLLSAEKGREAVSLPPLERQYSDYVRWQNDMLESDEGKRLWAYWQRQLAGELPVLDLPTDRPHPPVQTYNGASHTFTLTDELSEWLRGFARAEDATPFMVFLAAFQVLLHRYTGQEDILVGSPTTGRSRTEFSGIVGYFVNMMVLRANLSGNPTFRALLRQVRRTVWDAVEHQDYPFSLLVEHLQPKRDPSRSPIFQVSFGLHKSQKRGWVDEWMSGDEEVRIKIGGIEVAPFDIPQQEGQFDLSLELSDREKNFTGIFKYNTDLFDEATIARMTEHFRVLLEGILDNPEQALSRLPLLTEAERQQLLVWNRTETEYPKDRTIVDLFQEQVEKTPDNIAVVFEDRQLNYRELNSRANRLAHYLMGLGVSAENLVGIYVKRSPEMVIGLFGILKAGGAYVPLDPEYPQERLRFMLEDAGVKVLLSQSSLLEGLPASDAKVVCLDSEWEKIAGHSEDNPTRQSGPKNLAYVIYTSGSSGKPKGVMVEHLGLTNLIRAQTRDFGITPESHLLQFASFSFDASVSEIGTALTSGATLQLGAGDKFLPDEPFMRSIERQSVTHVTLPPSFLATLPRVELSGLETLVVAGEACASELVERWSSGRRFINAYGPTESTVCATVYECPAECGTDGNPPPIGKPTANTRIHILDAYQNLTPIGIPGELCIAGVGLARGYLNRPELTAEKFIEIEILGKTERLYKTGDLARWLPDGNLEYLGRLDHQVKLRGFRIEPGEIETRLARHPSIRQSAVIVWEPHPDDKRLVAYYASNVEPAPTPDELRHFMEEKLPDYMVPARFVLLEGMPLTPNGKIDRRRLPTPAPFQRGVEQEFIAPRTPIEKTLVDIWSDVLGRESIGIFDNFFELGGHSLLATRLFSLLREHLGMDLPLRVLFEHPTPAGLARAIHIQEDRPPGILFPFKTGAGNREPPLFCVHPIGGGAFCYRELAACLDESQPVYGIQAVGFEGKAEPLTTVEAMAVRYVEEITTLYPEDPCNLYGWSFGGVVAFEMARVLKSAGREVTLLVLADTGHPSAFKDAREPEEEEILFHLLAEASDAGPELFRRFRDMPPEDPITYLRRRITTGSDLAGFEDLERFIRIYRTNTRAFLTYRPSPWQGNLMFLAANQRIDTNGESVGLIWEELARVDRHVVPGNHFTMHRQPNVRNIAGIIAKALGNTLVATE